MATGLSWRFPYINSPLFLYWQRRSITLIEYKNSEVLFVGKQYNARIKRQRSKRRSKRRKKLLKEKLAKKFWYMRPVINWFLLFSASFNPLQYSLMIYRYALTFQTDFLARYYFFPECIVDDNQCSGIGYAFFRDSAARNLTWKVKPERFTCIQRNIE